jgi:hypothetical protein
MAQEANFDGHITIIYDGAGDERENIQSLKAQLEAILPQIA